MQLMMLITQIKIGLNCLKNLIFGTMSLSFKKMILDVSMQFKLFIKSTKKVYSLKFRELKIIIFNNLYDDVKIFMEKIFDVKKDINRCSISWRHQGGNL